MEIKLTALLESFLFVVSSVLFLPVLLSLTFLVFYMFFYLGVFLREYIERKSGHKAFVEAFKEELNRIITETKDRQNIDLEIEYIYQKWEVILIKSFDRIRFVVRVGPALGLMGTLIPMGIALSALAQGDLPRMAGSMVTAFTTVVVGLACSVVAFLLSMTKERWIRADLAEMEYLTEITLRKLKNKNNDINI